MVRQQSADQEVLAKTHEGLVRRGHKYHLAVTFGPDGLWVYLDGQRSAWQTAFVQGLEHHTQKLVIGANAWKRDEKNPYSTLDQLAGRISDFMLFAGLTSAAMPLTVSRDAGNGENSLFDYGLPSAICSEINPDGDYLYEVRLLSAVSSGCPRYHWTVKLPERPRCEILGKQSINR
jgi:hypothetical protein